MSYRWFAFALFLSAFVNLSTAAQQWPISIGGNGTDTGRIALDASGNVYVAGDFSGTVDFGGGPVEAPGSDAGYVARYDADGAFQWVYTFGGPSQPVPFGKLGLGVDPSGNVYLARPFAGSITVGGVIHQSAGREDVVVAKVNPDGGVVWSLRLGAGAAEVSEGLVIDADGNVYITGFFAGTANFGGESFVSQDVDMFIVKLDTDGNHVWSFRHGATADEHVRAIAMGPGPEITVTGFFGEGEGNAVTDLGGGEITSEGGGDAFVARYDANGGHIYSVRLGGPVVVQDPGGFVLLAESGSTVGVDDAGNAYVSGFFHETVDFGSGPVTSAGGADLFLIKLDAAGQTMWTRRQGGPVNDLPGALAASASGDVFLGGTFQESILLGEQEWVSLGAVDIFLARYDTDGQQEWSFAAGGPGNDFLPIPALHASDLYVTVLFNESVDLGNGTVTSAGGQDVFINRYDAGSPMPVDVEDPELPGHAALLGSAFPNPFSVRTRFDLEVSTAGHVRVEAFDLLGRRVAVLQDGVMLPGAAREVVFDGAGLRGGVYFVRASGAAFEETRVVVLLR